MAKEKGKRVFSLNEIEEIKCLVRQKEYADDETQKLIRRKIRKIGLRWNEVAGRSMKFNLTNLQKLFEIGVLKVEGDLVETYAENGYDLATPKHKNIIMDNKAIMNDRSLSCKGRKDSDEHYVIDLCDNILGTKALRQHRFEFLKGDTGVSLPVDAYYPELNLVVEYNEIQHTESTPFFDKKMTVSGVSRGEQRRIYDQRRREILPKYGIKLVNISYTDFGDTKKIKRDIAHNRETVEKILKNAEITIF